ncbi:nucleoside phosphorylase domain-containing protein [Emericellopsis atlantica]|uniref:Nucleoside phosphorylase domain-containing protein n=1 Tax=Emericellopsis atlantica TaxID=2614577 RepID=A0A9P8CR99_9HYPO|nr:nucleoside phosphorylase domain-containing protein [Emericellopsis atlantica]KAG9256513.1 nucleoside phosphorylase domain-containing protein [Emericellopsis atlantica]
MAFSGESDATSNLPLSFANEPTMDVSVYTVAWLAPLEIESQAACHMLDEVHSHKQPPLADCIYIGGSMAGHNVVIATFNYQQVYGTRNAGVMAYEVKRTFPNVKYGLLVGVAAGIPRHPQNGESPGHNDDIRLGDVVVAYSDDSSKNPILDYDLGKQHGHGRPLEILQGRESSTQQGHVRLLRLKDQDTLKQVRRNFRKVENLRHNKGTFVYPGSDKDRYHVEHRGETIQLELAPRPDRQRSRVYYGPIGSASKLVRDAAYRDNLRDVHGVLALEMEAAGIVGQFNAGVIRGICDYADKHKNKDFQPYAAAMAAAYARLVLAKLDVVAPASRPQSPPPREPAAIVERIHGKKPDRAKQTWKQRWSDRWDRFLRPRPPRTRYYDSFQSPDRFQSSERFQSLDALSVTSSTGAVADA